jgi:hypothetical protein
MGQTTEKNEWNIGIANEVKKLKRYRKNAIK